MFLGKEIRQKCLALCHWPSRNFFQKMEMVVGWFFFFCSRRKVGQDEQKGNSLLLPSFFQVILEKGKTRQDRWCSCSWECLWTPGQCPGQCQLHDCFFSSVLQEGKCWMEKRKQLGKHRPTILSLYKALIYKIGSPNTACSTFGKILEEVNLFFMFFDLLESSQNMIFSHLGKEHACCLRNTVFLGMENERRERRQFTTSQLRSWYLFQNSVLVQTVPSPVFEKITISLYCWDFFFWDFFFPLWPVCLVRSSLLNELKVLKLT